MNQFKLPSFERSPYEQDTAKNPVVYRYPPQWDQQSNRHNKNTTPSIPYLFGFIMILFFTGYGALMTGWLLVKAFWLATH